MDRKPDATLGERCAICGQKKKDPCVIGNPRKCPRRAPVSETAPTFEPPMCCFHHTVCRKNGQCCGADLKAKENP